MIQRIQTLWLMMAGSMAFVSLKVSFFSGNILVENNLQFQHFTGMNNFILLLLTVALGLASLVTIFMYGNRKKQLKIAAATSLLSVLNIVLYFYQTKKFIPSDWSYDLSAVVALSIPIFLLLAIRAIYKDEKLVKSVDRLR